MGISFDQVRVKSINPLQPVLGSFDKVNQARRDCNKVIPLAEGEKDQRNREAGGYRLKRINEAGGDVPRFSALLTEYNKGPECKR